MTVQITVEQLAALVGGQFASTADLQLPITGAAAISDALPGDVTFFGNIKYLSGLKKCRATAALVPLDFAEEIGPVAIRVQNPTLAFSLLVEKFVPPPITFAAGTHPSAVVGRGVELGEGVSIQAHVVIEDGVKIGANTVIGAGSYVGHEAKIGADCQIAPRVTVGSRSILGDRVILHSGVVLGGDGFGFEFSNGRHIKIPQVGIVQLDDDVEIGSNSTVDRARFGRTWIGEGTKIDNLVQIAHNVVIGKHCLVAAQSAVAGSSRLGNYVTMAGQTAVVGHVELGDQVIVAARGAVSKNFLAKEVLWGAPAVPIREAKEQMAMVRRLPKMAERLRRLEQLLEAQSAPAARIAESSPER
ncbi:MAG: UDP-3-O-acylglucosamine N-acyltransferase [Chthoniobacteraceae bacterium]|nr:UDP-3-O-acylglucosamine N-acyltransferase [Chthoniobacteraceae bacterium]